MQNKLLINGEWTDGVKGQVIDVTNPYDGSLITQVAEATEEDIDLAVSAAKEAFSGWSSLTATERGRYLLKLADLIDERSEELAQLETLDTGHPIKDTRFLDCLLYTLTLPTTPYV